MAATKGLKDYLFMAACEWFLMFWIFIDAALAYSLTKFAKKCQLQIPCLLCSRLDHFFENEERGSYSCLHLFCNKHQGDISNLIYCDLHNELVDVREMCEDCFNTATLQNQSNFRRSYLNKNFVGVACSCCKRQWKEKPFGQGPIQPNLVGSKLSKPITKPPLPRVARHGRPKRTRNRVKQRHKDASFPIGYPELKFTSDSEFEFLFSDDDGGGTSKVAGISERNSRDDTNSGNRYKILGRRTYSTPDLTSASLQRNDNSRTRTRTRARSASLTPNCLTRHSLAELNRKTEGKKQLSSMKSTRLWVDSLKKPNEHGSFGGSTMSCSSGSQNRYKTFSRNSYSASDLGSALLLEMHYNKSLPRRSASLTPNCLSWHGLAGLEQKFEESDSFKAMMMEKKPSSSRNSTCLSVPLSYADGHGSLDGSMVARSSGSQNRYNMFSRNSFSASDLGSALLLEMHNNKSLPRRAASLTPNSSAGHGLEEFQYPMNVAPPNVMKNKKSVSSSNVRSGVSTAYGHLDDSVISRKTGSHHNHNTIPRRHSYSVYQLGGDILLNMPTDESFTSSAFLDPYGYLSAMQFPVEKGEKDHQQFPPSSSINRLGSSSDFRSDPSNAFINKSKEYGFLDDSVVSRSTGIQHQNNMPRRHSYSFFELGCEVLLNMPYNESLASHSAYSTPNDPGGFGFGEPNNLNFQIRSSPSHNVMQIPHQKAKKGKKSLPSSNRAYGYKSSDDFYVSRKTSSSHNINKNPRRHSYSAFELGCAYLLDMPPFDECLTNRSASLTPNVSSDSIDLATLSALQFPLQMDFLRSLDDSVVSRNTGDHIHNQNRIPRRHSYSVFQLGGDILLNMPIDESLTGHSASLASHSLKDPQTSKFQKGEKEKKSLPPMSSVKSHSSSSGVTSDLSIDKTKWHGSFDDYLVLRSMANQNQNNIPRRHSVSTFDLGRALIVEVQVDNSLKNMHTSLAPNSSTEDGLGDLHQAHHHHHHHHHRAKRDKKLLPPLIPMNGLGSSSDVRSDLFTVSFNKPHGVGSLDNSFYSHNKASHNQNSNPRRHSYSAFELGCALMLNMQRDGSSRRRSASVTPKIQTNPSVPHSLDIGSLNSMQFGHKVKESHNLQSKKDEQLLQSTNSIRSDLPSTSLHKPHEYGFYDDSFLSHDKDSRKLYTNITRNSYSTSDLTSPALLQTNPNESFTFKSASLTPSCSTGQGLGELNLLTFQTGPSSSLQKCKKSDRPKAKKSRKLLSSANNVNMMSLSTNAEGILSTDSVDKTDKNESFDHSTVSNDMGSRNRYNTFSRNSQSASDLGSLQRLEIHHDGNSRSRSKSLTPDCYSHSLQPDSLISMQYHMNKSGENYHLEVEKDKKPLPVMQPAKETTSPTNIKSDLCPACLDKIDLRSLDGSIVSEIEYEGLEKVKRQAEDDVRCMRLLQSELEAERNAATVAANHAMNMITRLQQEKASLQMEALQYLRMMEEQAEYDMEALQKANELVEEKENEIQDLLDELEQYRSKYGDESLNNIKSFEDEKKYILESLSAIEKKIRQLSSGVTNKEKLESGHLNAENSLSTHNDSSISNGVLDKSQENESHVETGKKMVSKDGGEVDLATLEHEILDLKQKMGTLQADLDLLKHACNTLRGSEGLEFIQDIAHQLQDLRKYVR